MENIRYKCEFSSTNSINNPECIAATRLYCVLREVTITGSNSNSYSVANYICSYIYLTFD